MKKTRKGIASREERVDFSTFGVFVVHEKLGCH